MPLTKKQQRERSRERVADSRARKYELGFKQKLIWVYDDKDVREADAINRRVLARAQKMIWGE